jgi:hypothetical protein
MGRLTIYDIKRLTIVARSGNNWSEIHYTKRLFNPLTNELEDVKENV